jgi:catechol 2,3-dioxygenase-like lactoylglutathione lyase family enzyme
MAPSMTSSKIICFVATRDAGAARKFYETTLGLKCVHEDPFAIVFDVGGTMLRVQKVQELTPAKYTALGWEVADIAARIRELVNKQVRFERFPGLPQDELGVWVSPAGAKVAWFKDPDGNVLSLTEFPK